MSLNEDLINVKSIFEKETAVFKAASPSNIANRPEPEEAYVYHVFDWDDMGNSTDQWIRDYEKAEEYAKALVRDGWERVRIEEILDDGESADGDIIWTGGENDETDDYTREQADADLAAGAPKAGTMDEAHRPIFKAATFDQLRARNEEENARVQREIEQLKASGEHTVKFGPGTYFFGDIGYVTKEAAYDVLINGFDKDLTVFKYKGIRFAAAGTAYGDGLFPGTDGHRYAVDAGIIGIIPKELTNPGSGKYRGGDLVGQDLGRWLRVKRELTFIAHEGIFIVTVDGKSIMVDTLNESVNEPTISFTPANELIGEAKPVFKPASKGNLDKRKELHGEIKTTNAPYYKDGIYVDIKCPNCGYSEDHHKDEQRWHTQNHDWVGTNTENGVEYTHYICGTCGKEFRVKDLFGPTQFDGLHSVDEAKPIFKAASFSNRVARSSKETQKMLLKYKPGTKVLYVIGRGPQKGKELVGEVDHPQEVKFSDTDYAIQLLVRFPKHRPDELYVFNPEDVKIIEATKPIFKAASKTQLVQRREAPEACERCGKSVYFDKQPEYDVCTRCDKHICPECGIPAPEGDVMCKEHVGEDEDKENHSVHCYNCGNWADERDCTPNPNEQEGGVICTDCQRHVVEAVQPIFKAASTDQIKNRPLVNSDKLQDIASEVGLDLEAARIFKAYVNARWPDPDWNYAYTWAERFKKGTEWDRADLSGRTVLKRVAPGMYEAKDPKVFKPASPEQVSRRFDFENEPYEDKVKRLAEEAYVYYTNNKISPVGSDIVGYVADVIEEDSGYMDTDGYNYIAKILGIEIDESINEDNPIFKPASKEQLANRPKIVPAKFKVIYKGDRDHPDNYDDFTLDKEYTAHEDPSIDGFLILQNDLGREVTMSSIDFEFVYGTIGMTEAKPIFRGANQEQLFLRNPARARNKKNFKIGDRLVLISNDGYSANIGATAIIIGLEEQYVQVEWIHDHNWNDQYDGGYYYEDFKLAPSDNSALVEDMRPIFKGANADQLTRRRATLPKLPQERNDYPVEDFYEIFISHHPDRMGTESVGDASTYAEALRLKARFEQNNPGTEYGIDKWHQSANGSVDPIEDWRPEQENNI